MAFEDTRIAGEHFQKQITCHLSHYADKYIDDDAELSSVFNVASTWF